MNLRSVLLLLATLGIQELGAATIVDVSGQMALSFRTGDTLVFEIGSGSFGKNALAFGLPIHPTEISFALVSSPLLGSGDFSASLGPASGGLPLDFEGPLGFHDGTLSVGGSRSVVSTLRGYLQLSPQLSQEVFGGGTAVLRLRNDGPDVMIGLDSYTMRQDLFVSLSGGPMTVGGIVGSVTQESRGSLRTASFGVFEGKGEPGTLDSLSVAPEPGSSELFLAGGILLCVISAAMSKVSKRRK